MRRRRRRRRTASRRRARRFTRGCGRGLGVGLEVDEAFSLISRAIDTGRAAHGYLVVGDLKGGCDILRAANDFACGGLRPDLTLLLDVAPETAAARMRRREAATNTTADRMERAGEEFHARLRTGFAELA